MMTSTIRKFGVGVASVALVASAAVPAFADNDRQSQEVPGPLDGMVKLGRIGGFDRIETAIKIAEKAFADMGGDVEVAYIAGSSDASAVDSAAAGHLSDGPLYLVAGDNRSLEAVAKSITDNYPGVQKIIAIGGTAVVSDAALKAVADKALVTATDRISGADRYGTAAAIAEYGANNKGTSNISQWATDSASKVYLARGDNPVDALVSGVLKDAPVLLLGPDGTVPEATAAYLKKHLPSHFVALGGDKAVPTSSFLKADFDPVMKNKWLNNDEVKKAMADKAQAEFLLDGVPGGEGVNPNVKVNGTALDAAAKAVIDIQITNLETKIGTETDAADDADTASLWANYNKAVADAVGTNANTEKAALDLANYHYNGKSGGGSTDGRDDNVSAGTYKGSKVLAEEASQALDKAREDTKTVEDFKNAVNGLVDTYKGNKTNDTAQALETELVKLITAYGSNTSVSDIDDTTKADAFVSVWDAKKDALTSAMFLKSSGGDPDNSTTFFKTAAASDGVKDTLASLEAKTLVAAEDAFASADSRAKSDKAAYDRAKKAYEDKKAELTKSSDAVKKAKAKIDSAEATLRALKLKVNAGVAKAFMGYDKIEKRYSSINGVYNNGVRRLRAAIDSELSEAINAKAASPEALPAYGSLKNLVKAAYGIDLTTGNVREYFSFKKNNEGRQQVVRANHARMAEGKHGTYKGISTNDMVAQAVSMVDTFYNLTDRGFNTGEMEAYFANGGGYVTGIDGVTALYDGQTKSYNDLTPERKMLVDAAAKAVIDALITGASKTQTYWVGVDPTANVEDVIAGRTIRIVNDKSYTINPYGYVGAARVSDYLEGIAKRNQKSAEESLAKAKLAYQAAIDKITPKRYFRIEGSDRYNTSAAIAGYWRATYLGLGEENDAKKSDIYVANGISYIDAVAGGQLKNGPIVLAAPDGTMTDAVKQHFAVAAAPKRVITVYALGGTKAVPEQALTNAKAAAMDKSLLGKNFFTDATNKAVDNAKEADKKADEKK